MDIEPSDTEPSDIIKMDVSQTTSPEERKLKSTIKNTFTRKNQKGTTRKSIVKVNKITKAKSKITKVTKAQAKVSRNTLTKLTSSTESKSIKLKLKPSNMTVDKFKLNTNKIINKAKVYYKTNHLSKATLNLITELQYLHIKKRNVSTAVMQDIKKVNNDPLFIKYETECNFGDLLMEMNRYEAPEGGNIHHRGNIVQHSIWTARATSRMFMNSSRSKNGWIVKLLVDKIPVHLKRFTIVAAFLHDIGKVDGKTNVRNFIKKTHPMVGYNMMLNSNSIFYKLASPCVNYSKNKKLGKISAFLAIISKYHQVIGDVFKNSNKEGVIKTFLRNFYKTIGQFPKELYVFNVDDVINIFNIILLIGLCDVIGSRPVDKLQGSNKYEWELLNINIEVTDTMELKNTPWYRYKYETYGKEVITLFHDIFDKEFGVVKNKINSIAEHFVPEIINYTLNNKSYPLRYVVIPPGTFVYKTVNMRLKRNDFNNYHKPSWYGTEETANIYLRSNSYGQYLYKFIIKNPIKLLLMDDVSTVSSLTQMIKYMGQTYYKNGNKVMNDMYVKLYKYLNKAFNINRGILIRRSIINIDAFIVNFLNEIKGIDGYAAKPTKKSLNDKSKFHEEICVFDSPKFMNIVKLHRESKHGIRVNVIPEKTGFSSHSS